MTSNVQVRLSLHYEAGDCVKKYCLTRRSQAVYDATNDDYDALDDGGE
jgi:hypothetical protein